jgi:O-antigen/teichoic acid export membrane protein
MSFWRKSIFNAAIMVGQAAATRGLGILSNGLLARLLSPPEWGSLQAVANVGTTLSQVLKLSIDTGLQVRMSETGEPQVGKPNSGDFVGVASVVLFGLSVLAVLCSFEFSRPLARLFGEPSLARYIGLAGIAAAAQLATQIGAVLVALGHFKLYARINTFAALGYLSLLAVAYIAHSRGLTTSFVIFLAAQVAAGVTMVFCSRRAWRRQGIRARFGNLFPAFIDLAKIGLPVHLSAAAPSTVWLLFTGQLAEQAGIAALADLRIVATMSQFVGFIPSAIAQTFITQLAAARGADDQVPADHFLRYARLIIGGSTFTALAISVITPILVPIVFGSRYEATCQLVGVGLLTATVLAVKQCILVSLISERRSTYAVLDMVVATGTFALLASNLIPRFGAVGFIAAECSAHLLGTLALAVAMSLRVKGTERAREGAVALVMLVVGLVAIALSAITMNQAWHWLAGSLLLFTSSALNLAFLFTAAERRLVRREVALYLESKARS